MRLFGLLAGVWMLCATVLYGAEASYTVSPTLTEAVGIKDPQKLLNNQIRILDALIDSTRHSLDGQQQLKLLIADYQHVQDEYLKDTNDKDTLIRMVRLAARVLDTIKSYHLTQEFDPEFIGELNLFSQIANKRGIPKP